MRSSRLTKFLTATGAAMLLALVTLKTFFIDHYRIPQDGMYPTLPAGSHLFASKRAYAGPADVRRGDIVVFVREENGQRYNYIWRVIALPDETIEASGESLTVDGATALREHLREADRATIYRERIADASYEIALGSLPAQLPPAATLTVPPDHFFVMGDNRFGARDSRYFGPIPFSSIIGKKL
ncbi:MAG: signal peptidase I [Planctomycetaceae bacterium]